jgi:probable rRNA maturation factor
LRKLVRAVLAGESRAGAEVGLLLTDNAELREMNRVYRGIDRVTDVLAFPDGDGDAGDIAISLERAAEQAPRFSATFEQEVARLVIHGLLHLLGYDHHTPADGRRMKARERLYLAGVTRGSIVTPARRNTAASRKSGASGAPRKTGNSRAAGGSC